MNGDPEDLQKEEPAGVGKLVGFPFSRLGAQAAERFNEVVSSSRVEGGRGRGGILAAYTGLSAYEGKADRKIFPSGFVAPLLRRYAVVLPVGGLGDRRGLAPSGRSGHFASLQILTTRARSQEIHGSC